MLLTTPTSLSGKAAADVDSFAGRCNLHLTPPTATSRPRTRLLLRLMRHQHSTAQRHSASIAAKLSASPAPANNASPQFDQRSPLHVRELVGTQRIARGAKVTPLPVADQPTDLMGVTFQDASGQVTYLGDWIESNDTDGFLVMHKGQVISEFYSPDMTPTSNHGLGSLTRNFVASSIAILAEQGRLSLDAPVQTYMPEMTQSGYAGATIQQLLDMRSGVASSMMQIMQATGWTISGSTAQSTPEGVHELLLTLPKEVDHGGAFKYRAGDTELLGCLCERVAGQTMGQVVSELIWQPIGAQQDADLMLDKQRTPLYSGGMSAALRDVAKFGALWLSDGASNGKQIIPSAFIHDTRHGSADAQNAFVNSAAPGNKHFFGLLASPGKMYKNQTWNLDETRGTVLMYGAAGQIIYTDPPAGLMCVVLSHWPGAFVPERVQGWLGALDALRAHLDLSTT